MKEKEKKQRKKRRKKRKRRRILTELTGLGQQRKKKLMKDLQKTFLTTAFKDACILRSHSSLAHSNEIVTMMIPVTMIIIAVNIVSLPSTSAWFVEIQVPVSLLPGCLCNCCSSFAIWLSNSCVVFGASGDNICRPCFF